MQTPEKNNYEFHEDAGHGWLRVPYVELSDLGVQPSKYSYMDTRREFAYLEEDIDAGLFLDAIDPECIREIRAARARGEEPKVNIWDKWHIKNINDGDHSWIRDLNRIGKITPKPKPPTDGDKLSNAIKERAAQIGINPDKVIVCTCSASDTQTKEVTPDSEKGKALLKALNETAKGVKAMPDTLFPEIFYKFGICTESEAERKAKGSLRERYVKACRVIQKLNGWRTDSWYLMPVLWLEAKADELREKADAARAAADAEAIVKAKAA